MWMGCLSLSSQSWIHWAEKSPQAVFPPSRGVVSAGEAEVLPPVSNGRHGRRRGAFKKHSCESADPLNVCLCCVVDHTLFYSMWERTLENKWEVWNHSEYFHQKDFFNYKTIFPQYLENQFWLHFFLLQKPQGIKCFDCVKSLFQFLWEKHFQKFQIDILAMKHKHKYILMSLKSRKPAPRYWWISSQNKKKKNPRK